MTGVTKAVVYINLFVDGVYKWSFVTNQKE